MPYKEHDTMDEYRCTGLQETKSAVETLIEWQKRQNGSLERVEKTLVNIYDTLLSDARLTGKVSKLALLLIALMVMDLGVHLGPELAGKTVRALLGLP